MNSKMHGLCAMLLLMALCLLPAWGDKDAFGATCLIVATVINVTGFFIASD